ncbi:MAG: prepilin-type N-terminal cleavage/methylation domain-containing protein [Planctomycetota bacterium]|jgi:prepilin-type N-terminal cleavage/methylation domain-containing protein
MHRSKKHTGLGFSMLELVIVIVILGIIAAIAIPRMSRGSEGAADAALTANLAVLRNAIDLFVAEHDGVYPAAADCANALSQYSNKLGDDFVTTRDNNHIYGPYIRQVPPLPVGAAKGNTGIAAAAGAGVGWIYDVSTGAIQANTTATEKDASGTLYSDY